MSLHTIRKSTVKMLFYIYGRTFNKLGEVTIELLPNKEDYKKRSNPEMLVPLVTQKFLKDHPNYDDSLEFTVIFQGEVVLQ